MLGQVSTYSREDHTFIAGEIGGYISRLAKESNRDLAVIRYEKLGVFCIIEFLSPKRDVFVDVKNLGDSLANFGRATANELRQRLFKPTTCDQVSRFIADTESDYHHMRQDDNSAEWENEERTMMGE
jgi:hypothetical protein